MRASPRFFGSTCRGSTIDGRLCLSSSAFILQVCGSCSVRMSSEQETLVSRLQALRWYRSISWIDTRELGHGNSCLVRVAGIEAVNQTDLLPVLRPLLAEGWTCGSSPRVTRLRMACLVPTPPRHPRARPGDPRVCPALKQFVGGRAKPGHDDRFSTPENPAIPQNPSSPGSARGPTSSPMGELALRTGIRPDPRIKSGDASDLFRAGLFRLILLLHTRAGVRARAQRATFFPSPVAPANSTG